MITVDRKLLDMSRIAGEYPPGSIGRNLLDVMSGSSENYVYGSLDELKFELDLRSAIVKASQDLWKSGLSFAVFHDSRCNEEYWDRTSNGGFKLKPGQKGSVAIRDIYENRERKYATECATAMMIVYFKALLDVFGAEKFDAVFKDIYLMNWSITEPLLKEVGRPGKVADVLLGDRGYFNNPDVDPVTPEWQGENVIVMPDSMYYGHGIGLTTAGTIIQALNRHRKKDSAKSAYFMDSVSRPDFRKIFKSKS